MNGYNEMLKRFTAYRKWKGMTQEQMAAELHITQEQCSYLENGITKITDRQLKTLLEIGWDIDCIITGVETDRGKTELEEVLDSYGNEKEDAMKLCGELILKKALGQQVPERDSRFMEDLALLKEMLRSWEHFSMCRYLRKKLKLPQTGMAEKLGIGIKKYRDLEREERYPNAEMLLYFYEVSGYPPVLFMEVSNRRMIIINQVWDRLGKKEREEILGFAGYMRGIL